MNNLQLLSKLVEQIELEILTTEESALIGGTSGPIGIGNNCKCNGNNCDCTTVPNNCKCNGNNCDCSILEPEPGGPIDIPIKGPND